MDNVISKSARMHPMMVAAAASVTLVSLVGVAAITGLLPTSHGTALPTVSAIAAPTTAASVDQTTTTYPSARYAAADGKVLQEIPLQRVQTGSTASAYDEAPVGRDVPIVQHKSVVHHNKVAHHASVATRAPVRYYDDQYTQNAPVSRRQAVRDYNDEYVQNTYSQPVNNQSQRTQPQYAAPQHPVVNYVNDMHPVGTGVGAVLGGLLGNQVGGGNGKKLATVAGVLFGGYAGNEVAHNRSPLPGQ